MGRSPGAAGPLGVRSFSRKTLSILIYVYKMENNYETLRMPELKALARECRLRNYSRLRKADLIVLLQDNEHQAQRRQRPPQRHAAPALRMSTWEPNRPPQRHAVPAPRMPTWEPNRPSQMSPFRAPPRDATWEPECEQENEVRQPELEAPLTKRQLKHR